MVEEDEIKFKSIKRKNVRKRRNCSSDEENVEIEDEVKLEFIHKTKEKQKLRNRSHGINLASLALGKKVTLEEEVNVKDPFNLKTGGIVNMNVLKAEKRKVIENDTIGTQFSVETNICDTDEQMMNYIENKMNQRKGIKKNVEANVKNIYLSPEEAAILSLAANLRETSMKKSEEMLSNQMLNGIPEVQLGIDTKINNIEATEEAIQKIIDKEKNKKELPSHFVPINYAVNFDQHQKFDVNRQQVQRKKQEHDRDESNINFNKKATDDFHYDKFRK